MVQKRFDFKDDGAQDGCKGDGSFVPLSRAGNDYPSTAGRRASWCLCEACGTRRTDPGESAGKPGDNQDSEFSPKMSFYGWVRV